MEFSEKDYKILYALDQKEISTQRQLSKQTGISLGQVNFALKQLLAKGLIKIGNFRSNPQKIGYAYLLTPKGIEAKSKLAARFIISKLKEYNELKNGLTEKLYSISENGPNRIVIIGSEIIKDFIISIIADKSLPLQIVEYYSQARMIKQKIGELFDFVLFLDGNEIDEELLKLAGIPAEKIITL